MRTAFARRDVLPVGGWHLSVVSGLCRVSAAGIACNRRDDPAMAMHVANCLSLPDEQKLAAAEVRASGAWRFEFDLGGALSIAADLAADPREAVWTLLRRRDEPKHHAGRDVRA